MGTTIANHFQLIKEFSSSMVVGMDVFPHHPHHQATVHSHVDDFPARNRADASNFRVLPLRVGK